MKSGDPSELIPWLILVVILGELVISAFLSIKKRTKK